MTEHPSVVAAGDFVNSQFRNWHREHPDDLAHAKREALMRATCPSGRWQALNACAIAHEIDVEASSGLASGCRSTAYRSAVRGSARPNRGRGTRQGTDARDDSTSRGTPTVSFRRLGGIWRKNGCGSRSRRQAPVWSGRARAAVRQARARAATESNTGAVPRLRTHETPG